MKLRRATDPDRRALATYAAPLQQRAEHHVGFLGLDADGIAEEMLEDVDDWTEAAVVAEVDGTIGGWLMGSIDHDMGRVWWLGPFVDTDDPAAWCATADALDGAARALLGDHVTEEEYAFDARHFAGGDWAVRRGFTADPGSAVLTLDHLLDPPTRVARRATDADVATVGPLHERLFPNTHTTGAKLLAETDPNRPRLILEREGAVLGYIAVERQPDGGGYIDFVGVDPAHRRTGFGAELVRAGVAALAELGCERFHLTVREANHGARALYAGLGFTEERVIQPFRRGFSLP